MSRENCVMFTKMHECTELEVLMQPQWYDVQNLLRVIFVITFLKLSNKDTITN